ncbi:MAG TPA: aminopeptidase P N-terminal domain-containing protein [Verrucomicrobiales bacterium]|nr:aminopeptidase P N-terminal domain-containing protein [Verrucomicrobiales bacterium]
MKYSPIDPHLFVENRKRLAAKLLPNSLAILNANDVPPTNADGTTRFRQNSDLFYLSGIDQEETVLALFPDCRNEKHREILFVRRTDDLIAVWEGARLTEDQARERSGIAAIHWLDSFPRMLRELMIEAKHVYLNTNEHLRATTEVESRDQRFLRRCMTEYPLHRYERLAPLLHELRPVKSSVELDLIREACRITGQAFRRILGFVRPGVTEYEIEAELIHEFVRNRATGFAYLPIIASGAGSCVLHYIENDQTCRDGDLLLLDVGAEYANYAADLTRTLPVNGRFSDRQRDVYQAVLRIQRQAISLLRPGTRLKSYQEEVASIVEEELIRLKLFSRADVEAQDSAHPLYKRYFMHGTAHHLGLDVHDVSVPARPLEPGMVMTCEPGIYIREENLGVRLENDILITEDGNLDLMADIPIEPGEIEDLMQG